MVSGANSKRQSVPATSSHSAAAQAGRTARTRARRRFMLGPDRVELGPEEAAGLVRHRGWSLQFDLPSRLAWPVFPYSPYADAPKTSLGFAVGGADGAHPTTGGGQAPSQARYPVRARGGGIVMSLARVLLVLPPEGPPR